MGKHEKQNIPAMLCHRKCLEGLQTQLIEKSLQGALLQEKWNTVIGSLGEMIQI